jgi:hypothetical protein
MEQKNKYEIIKATIRPDFKGVEAGGKKMRFGKQGALRVSDPGMANEIRSKYGTDVTVTRIDTRPKDQRKTFTAPAFPWQTYDENGRRIK